MESNCVHLLWCSVCIVIEDNPYNLLRIAPDMFFSTADTLAEHLGINGSDDRRLGG